MPTTPTLGVGGRLFADPVPTPDETSFQVDNTSDQCYDSPYYEAHANDPVREAGQLALVLATHRPPASADAKHGGGTGLATDIDRCCQQAGIWPDVVLSGHAHLYERFTRVTSDGRQIPYIGAGAGAGGYAATPPRAGLTPPQTWGDYTLVAPPIAAFGYLTVAVDLTAQTLELSYHPSDSSIAGDQVTVNLTNHTLS